MSGRLFFAQLRADVLSSLSGCCFSRDCNDFDLHTRACPRSKSTSTYIKPREGALFGHLLPFSRQKNDDGEYARTRCILGRIQGEYRSLFCRPINSMRERLLLHSRATSTSRPGMDKRIPLAPSELEGFDLLPHRFRPIRNGTSFLREGSLDGLIDRKP